MAKCVILAVALVACFASITDATYVNGGACPGCKVHQDPNQYPDLIYKLQAALASIGDNTIVQRIYGYQTQVVAGTKNYVDYISTDGASCEATWVDQPWVSPLPQDVTNQCQPLLC